MNHEKLTKRETIYTLTPARYKKLVRLGKTRCHHCEQPLNVGETIRSRTSSKQTGRQQFHLECFNVHFTRY